MILFFSKISHKLHAIYRFVKIKVYGVISKKSHFCRIEEIDVSKKMFVLHCRGIDAPVKMSFDQLVNDPVMLSALSPKHAAWVGYYYGKYYYNLTSGNKFCDMKSNFNLDDSQENFRIIMLNRQGDIIYTEKETQKNYISSPIKLVSDEMLVSNFSSIQACYIGILAGTKSNKPIKKLMIRAECTYLKLVK